MGILLTKMLLHVFLHFIYIKILLAYIATTSQPYESSIDWPNFFRMPTKTSSCNTIIFDLTSSISYINSVILRYFSILPWSGRSQRKDKLQWVEFQRHKRNQNLTHIHVLGFSTVVGIISLVSFKMDYLSYM